ncbi:hypothetical protein BHE90_002214 [Fusarium euwallaceae]|uniref:Uncharacterized protein n=3 Tax=Fusarium solani species complex TaxID=232080 RepID=A0A3M2RQT9_9HYPO|nr:hypothetical protein CDV36_012704 [Fusarium kuroshium]RTE83261.1 hypothetical protein BHE90_002214 [Fusarium euwallaceae]
MSSDANLLALPYEVREQVFQHYFKLDRGYFYDGESEKLVTADGQPIDLSLVYTCHSIANDTKHIPLSVNTITFSTVYREDWRERASGLAYILKCHHLLQADMVYHLLRFVTPEMYSQIGLQFPQSMPNIREELTTELQFHEGTNWRPALDWISVKLEFLEKQRESDYLESSHIFCKREKKRLRNLRRRLARAEEAEVEDDAEAGQTMRTLFGDVYKAPPCMTRFEKKMYRKERRAQKAAASASDQTQADPTDIEDTESTIFGDFFEPRTGLWWW